MEKVLGSTPCTSTNLNKMGLTSWKNAPEGKIRRSDVSIAKNYLDEDELRQLNRFVTMYLDYAETQAEKRQTMTMKNSVGACAPRKPKGRK